jgi:hypothetical protein
VDHQEQTIGTGDAVDDESARSMPVVIAALASAGAGIIHASAVGVHAEHTNLSRGFALLATAQVAAAVVALVRPGRWGRVVLVAVNSVALASWVITRNWGISWIDGLQQAESPQLADTAAAVLAGAAICLPFVPRSVGRALGRPVLVGAAAAVGILSLAAMVNASSHEHGEGAAGHGHAESAAADHTAGADHPEDHADPVAAAAAGDGAADHGHADEQPHADDQSETTIDHAHDVDAASVTWPRPWDPAAEIDFSGVPGVSPEQQQRAEQLVADTLVELPQFADVTTLAARGYASIGDASTGFEHYINRTLLADDVWLDPSAPESLVFRVDGDDRTLVSAMFIVGGRAIDDPELVDYGGPLMQWHVHDNLCWGLDAEGQPKVMAVTDDAGSCPPGTVLAGGDAPMVHVWIAPHQCGPFAALEGHGAGQAAVDDASRVDQCGHDHGAADDGVAAAARPYDPALPIDLGGLDGVTPQQQAFAENLVAATVRDLPQWADPAVAEAAGFHSIGDGITGHEHYVKWDWIDDDVWLDPDQPESLVYEPQPDGSKTLVSAMFMLPTSIALEEVPDWGGALMQWHIHDDLCLSDDPVARRVIGITSVGGPCRPPSVKMDPAAMIHVWIRPHECGPFAALEGIAAGQVRAGETHVCDHAHGAG